MTRTISRSYDTYVTARSVVEQLLASGISSSNVSIVGRNGDGETNAEEGAGIGAGLGGAAGLLAGRPARHLGCRPRCRRGLARSHRSWRRRRRSGRWFGRVLIKAP